MNVKRTTLIILSLAVGAMVVAMIGVYRDIHRRPATVSERPAATSGVRLYWFIPDGLRAEPDVFTVFEWARQGLLPNIRQMMEQGAYGYSVPVFPGHTPTNFATLLTGTTPSVHGVADGPMRLQRYPLSVVSMSGFSSHAKRVPPIWYTLEEQGAKVALLSVPGSTPPELSRGITVRGRWGGWGMDFPAVNFHTATDNATRMDQGIENRLFGQGAVLTRYLSTTKASGWSRTPPSYSEPREIELTNWGATVFGFIYDSTDDGRENYDRILFSRDRDSQWADVAVGEWSDWLPITLHYELGNDYNLFTPKKAAWERKLTEVQIPTEVRVKVIRLGERDFFRVRFYYNALNRFMAKPATAADQMISAVGPMVDYPDNFPAQLIYYPEDKDTLYEEAMMSLNWHRDAAGFMIRDTDAEVIIHDIYTPNQFLTSRWWMRYLDPTSSRYHEASKSTRAALWSEVLDVYKGIDAILGEILSSVDEETYVVLSSDHGIIPLETEVNLNALFAREGLLHYKMDPETGYHTIDWSRTRVVYLKMDNIYVNPDGLDGNYARASGPEYLRLRQRVADMLRQLEDGEGRKPVARVTAWEDAQHIDLPADRVGDLIIANNPGFGWSENIDDELSVFEPARVSGYKQAVIPENVRGMWTPFIVMGPGVRKGYELREPVRHVDQYPTIMKLIGEDVPDFVEGSVIRELVQ